MRRTCIVSVNESTFALCDKCHPSVIHLNVCMCDPFKIQQLSQIRMFERTEVVSVGNPMNYHQTKIEVTKSQLMINELTSRGSVVWLCCIVKNTSINEANRRIKISRIRHLIHVSTLSCVHTGCK